MKKLYFQTREEWRAWLSENHASENEVWLVYYKKGTGKPSMKYGESVEEAICFGWVDSIIKKIDEERYVRKFTPRREDSAWSESNKKRAEKMIKQDLMTEHGLRLVDTAKVSGKWDEKTKRPELTSKMSPEFRRALDENPKAKQAYGSMPRSHQKEYLGWIETTKRPETRQRRIAESIRLLEKNEKLGLK